MYIKNTAIIYLFRNDCSIFLQPIHTFNTIAIQKKFKQNYNSAKNTQALGALPPSFGLPYFPFGVRKGSGKDN